MALITPAAGIISIRGRFGGVYFKKDNSGQHIQAMPRRYKTISMTTPVIPPASPGGSRAAYIHAWTNMARFYAYITVFVYFPLWVQWAIENKSYLPKSEGKKLSVYQWFSHLNIKRLAENLPPYTYPPKGASPQYGDQGYRPYKLPNFTIVGKYCLQETIGLYAAGYSGTYNDKPYYLPDHQPSYKTLWWTGEWWVLSQGLGEFGEHWWFKIGDDETGIYDPGPVPTDGILIVNY